MNENTVSYELSHGAITLYGAFKVPSSEAGDGTVDYLEQKTQDISNKLLSENGVTFTITKVVKAQTTPSDIAIPSIAEIKDIFSIVSQRTKELLS